MIKNINEIIECAKSKGPKTIAVAVAQDLDVLLAINEASKLGIANAILVGEKELIEKVSLDNDIAIDHFEIIDIKDIKEASRRAVELVSSGKAHMAMKGLVDTSIFLKAVLDTEIGLRTDKVISGVAAFEVPGYDRLLLVTDPAINIEPNLATKKQIIENAVEVAHALEIDEPKVAVLCAKEKVNPKMPATVDAKELEEMNKRGEIKKCIVGGPFALDNIVSEKAAIQKGIAHPVAGKADIIMVPNIDTGNSLFKSMTYFAKAKYAGAVVGTKEPIIITSRSDSHEAKLNTIALAVLMAKGPKI